MKWYRLNATKPAVVEMGIGVAFVKYSKEIGLTNAHLFSKVQGKQRWHVEHMMVKPRCILTTH